jgi:hypothetical protein
VGWGHVDSIAAFDFGAIGGLVAFGLLGGVLRCWVSGLVVGSLLEGLGRLLGSIAES